MIQRQRSTNGRRSTASVTIWPVKTRITTFDPRSAAVDTIRLQAGDFESVLLLNGTEKRLLHVVATHSVAPTVVFHEFMDEAGESWKTTIPSSDMVVHMVPKATALKAFAETEEP